MHASLMTLAIALPIAALAQTLPPPDRTPGKHEKMDHGAHEAMQSPFGAYSMTRDASGTAWQPEATPMEGLMLHAGDWETMVHGFVYGVHDRQGGPRGDRKTFAESMFMVMAQRPFAAGKLGLRAMLSLDPAMGAAGYPLLFQTGETADGRTALVDRQHPHDAFMELSASYSASLGREASAFVYAGLPGEPALGPPTFMHRFSGMRIPEAPLTHHWLDSTHVTFGVVTLGAMRGAWKAEASWFNGREPDERRWNIETRGFDSWSARLTWNPSPQWSLQASYGDLESPEGLEPETRVRRTTLSASHHAAAMGGQWQTTFAWGRNDKISPGGRRALPGWLLESTYRLRSHTIFGRLERVKNDELFGEDEPLHGRAFVIEKVSLGYIQDFAKTGAVNWGVGVLGSAYRKPAELDPHYGSRPHSVMFFIQARM